MVVAAVVLVWFQPQTLLYDRRVDEGVPTAAPGSGSPVPGGATAAAAQPVEIASGGFVSRGHRTVGSARVLRLSDGRVVVRFEDFATSNGPALVVWLSGNSAQGEASAFAADHVDLGTLKGNVGDQNYIVPGGVDTTAFTSVVVWCDRFDVPFGAADLGPST
ncbi:DM13 domain-containing protein [Geodermatophilus sp. YIM 151500]|uniref:DM13 domain-containing protein n=1 Tax=Geodermatophilus sp. YIM 151500 TaxID=2984531 RepID=UPI0021E36A6B|nr:DM13 domain-containing protein [Geodermatophilus sp. YIM 151500]MCV2491938.1 DM13 domain-containing protein [Geodermatophilus sp. YIM 151500]